MNTPHVQFKSSAVDAAQLLARNYGTFLPGILATAIWPLVGLEPLIASGFGLMMLSWQQGSASNFLGLRDDTPFALWMERGISAFLNTLCLVFAVGALALVAGACLAILVDVESDFGAAVVVIGGFAATYPLLVRIWPHFVICTIHNGSSEPGESYTAYWRGPPIKVAWHLTASAKVQRTIGRPLVGLGFACVGFWMLCAALGFATFGQLVFLFALLPYWNLLATGFTGSLLAATAKPCDEPIPDDSAAQPGATVAVEPAAEPTAEPPTPPTAPTDPLPQRDAATQRKSNRELVLAAKVGDTEGVLHELANGADPNTIHQKENAWSMASVWGDTTILRALIDAGFDVHDEANAVWIYQSLLDAVRTHGRDYLQFHSDLGLATRGLLIPATDQLHAEPDVVEYLLRNGDDPNAETDDGLSPLFFAALYGHTKIVEALLEHGADRAHTDSFGRTACHVASEFGHLDVATMLDTGAVDPRLAGQSSTIDELSLDRLLALNPIYNLAGFDLHATTKWPDVARKATMEPATHRSSGPHVVARILALSGGSASNPVPTPRDGIDARLGDRLILELTCPRFVEQNTLRPRKPAIVPRLVVVDCIPKGAPLPDIFDRRGKTLVVELTEILTIEDEWPWNREAIGFENGSWQMRGERTPCTV